ncbi:MAG: hypothetical protein ACRDDY_13815 [Clostridium sp.]|uniref:hypothetical protein n=1 Tax=Clostridium sp. TaxID=1506 RepID=UPI003EE78FFC
MLEELQPVVSTVISRLAGLVKQSRSDSIIEVSSNTRNEFLTLVTSDVAALPYSNEIMQSCLTLVTSYMLSAISTLVEIDGINDREILDQINTNRDPLDSLLGAGAKAHSFLGTESWQYGLPNPEISGMLLNAQRPKSGKRGFEAIEDVRDERGMSFGRTTQADLRELANLSVGKSFEVVFEANGNRKPVNMQVRLMVSDVDDATMLGILRSGSTNNSFKERLIRVRAGSLHWFHDLIMLNDLIDEARRTRIKDKSKFYRHILSKRSKNFLSGLFSLRPSVNNASAILAFTTRQAEELELEMGGELDDYAIRQRVFESTYTMIMVVVDTQWEQVTFYHRGIDQKTTVSVDALKRANKKGGAEVEDVLRAYTAGAAPSY